jgi:GNAT superfamily N-acetyltransferase
MASTQAASRVHQLLDEHWTATLGVAPSVWRDAEVVVASHPEPSHSDHVYLIRRNESCIIVVPESLVGSTTIACAQWPSAAVFDRAFVRSLYGASVSAIHGPMWLGYATADTFEPVADPGVRPLGEADRAALDVLHAAVGEDEWVDAGMVTDTRQEYGWFDGDELAAVGTLNPFGGAPANVGVLTHPRHRNEGLGAAVVSALTSIALAHSRVAQCRVLAENGAAVRVARQIGYVEDGRTLEVVLRGPMLD